MILVISIIRVGRFRFSEERPANYTMDLFFMAKHSKHQQKIIKNYYDNREAIALQRVQELVTELYLTEGKQRERHWKTMVTQLEALGISSREIQHLQEQDNPELIAELVKRVMAKS